VVFWCMHVPSFRVGYNLFCIIKLLPTLIHTLTP